MHGDAVHLNAIAGEALPFIGGDHHMHLVPHGGKRGTDAAQMVGESAVKTFLGDVFGGDKQQSHLSPPVPGRQLRPCPRRIRQPPPKRRTPFPRKRIGPPVGSFGGMLLPRRSEPHAEAALSLSRKSSTCAFSGQMRPSCQFSSASQCPGHASTIQLT